VGHAVYKLLYRAYIYGRKNVQGMSPHLVNSSTPGIKKMAGEVLSNGSRVSCDRDNTVST
jgi:hypothetical protein